MYKNMRMLAFYFTGYYIQIVAFDVCFLEIYLLHSETLTVDYVPLHNAST